jgi:hypothetical protein
MPTNHEMPVDLARAYSTKRAALYCALAPITLAKLRVSGGGPAFRKLTSTRVVYLREDLDEWLSSRPRLRSTSDAAHPANAAA